MATTLTNQILNDGERNAIVKIFIDGGSSATDLSEVIAINKSELNGTFDDLKIMKIQPSIPASFTVDLLWDADTNVNIISLADGQNVERDYRGHGGLPNNAGAGKTGDILLTTTGVGNNDTGHIILEMKKRTKTVYS